MTINTKQKRWSFILLLLGAIIILALYPLPAQDPIQYYDRESGELKTEQVAAEKWLIWLYNNPVGKATLRAMVQRKLLSTVYGRMMDSPSSAKKIQPFIEDFDIDMSAAQKQEFSSFNDFFTRKLKNNARPIDGDSTVAVSPADGKLMVYPDISNSDFIIKGYNFDIVSFLNDSELAQHYLDGTLVVIRLAPTDYHRFHFPISGTLSSTTQVKGQYLSVNPLALRKMTEIFCLNKREYTTISNPLFGDLIMAEVGATMVGSILQSYSGDLATKGHEKGYFEFGGSTVVLLFEKGKISIDDDLVNNSLKGYETAVKEGERIGTSLLIP